MFFILIFLFLQFLTASILLYFYVRNDFAGLISGIITIILFIPILMIIIREKKKGKDSDYYLDLKDTNVSKKDIDSSCFSSCTVPVCDCDCDKEVIGICG